jgi:hypothetical protein
LRLGRNRALALEATIDPATTGELARRIGVSAATATSTSVPRQARVISTRRNGGAVLDSVTARGAMLLDVPRQTAPPSAMSSA